MTTTIKVSSDVRDRLKAQAQAAHVTLGEYLRRLADMAERQQRFDLLRTAIAETSPADDKSLRHEVRQWEATEFADEVPPDRNPS